MLSSFVIYYNAFLAYKGRPAFKVGGFMPQILFPRGEEGLGRHNIDEMINEKERELLVGRQMGVTPGGPVGNNQKY